MTVGSSSLTSGLGRLSFVGRRLFRETLLSGVERFKAAEGGFQADFAFVE